MSAGLAIGEVDWTTLRSEYEAGATFSDLRKKTGIDERAIARGLRSIGTTIRRSGHRVGRPAPWNAGSRTNRFRECSECGGTRRKIVCATPPICRGCWDRQRRRSASGKDSYLRRTYGLTLDQATRLLAQQGGRCLVCRAEIDLFLQPWQGGAVVDHDHDTGEIRGLLCHGCNVAIGLIGPGDRLSRAQHYLLCSRAKIHESAQLFYPVVMTRPERISIGAGCRIDSLVKLEGGDGLTVEQMVHVASGAHVNIAGGVVVLGDESAVASGGRILGGSADPSWPSMSAAAPADRQHAVRGVTVIGPRAVVGASAVVLPGCHLGEGAILAAGAVATRPIPAMEIWAGVPARRIGIRPTR